MSSAERALVHRASMLLLQSEMLESQFAAQDGVATVQQLDVYQRLVGTIRRTLESLGLKRRAKNVTPPDLRTHLRQGRRRDAEDAEFSEVDA